MFSSYFQRSNKNCIPLGMLRSVEIDDDAFMHPEQDASLTGCGF